MDTIVFHLMPYQATTDEAWPFPNDTFDPDLGSSYYEEYFQQLELAEALGFDGIGFNEHHFNTYGLQPSPNLTAAHMAARTEDITLALFGNLIPIRRNPVRLAEELAMLDTIAEGRLICGFPRGIPSEYLAYNVDYDDSRERQAEGLDLIKEVWTADEPFDWDGEHYQFENVYAWPRPYQEPHPRMWMPATSEASLAMAAERRLPTGTVGPSAEQVKETFERYSELAEASGWTPTKDDFTVIRRIYVAETNEQAHAEAKEHLEFQQEVLFAGTHRGVAARNVGDKTYDPNKREKYLDVLPPSTDHAVNFDYDATKDADNILIGDPDYVAREIERQQDIIGGFGTLVGGFHFGDLPSEKMEKSMRLYAEEVMPRVRRL